MIITPQNLHLPLFTPDLKYGQEFVTGSSQKDHRGLNYSFSNRIIALFAITSDTKLEGKNMMDLFVSH